MDILQGLNQAQQQAVTTTEGYIRVAAGAGTGKTRALTRRYAYLAEAMGIPTEHILCVTFTNKAANEMKQRVRSMIGEEDTGYICTFHSLGLQILKEDIHTIGWPSNFMVLDSEDKESLLKSVFADMDMTIREMTLKRAADLTDDMKWDLLYVSLLEEEGSRTLLKRMAEEPDRKRQMFYRYLYEQKKIFALDFEDLVDMAVSLLQRNESLRRKWQDRFEYVLVDEFQDIDGKQYELAHILSQKWGNLFVVGDPDQTIYTWRGADVQYILDFPKRYPEAKTIYLNENYRSTPQILALSNALIAKNAMRLERNLYTNRPEGPKPRYFHGKDAQKEAAFIAGDIAARLREGVPCASIAVLYRAHYVSRSLEDALFKAGIPYVIWGGMEFYGRREIKDALCYLRMLENRDDLAFARVVNQPRRGVGFKRMELLKACAAEKGCSLYEALLQNLEHPLIQSSKAGELVSLIKKYEDHRGMKLSELLHRLLTESGYLAMLKAAGDGERLDNLAELLQAVEEYEASAGEECSLSEYLAQAALYTDRDREQRRETVKLMTVHNGKGLEFDHVYIAGLNEGIFPSRRTDTVEAMEEERRLCYVACTRAGKTLTLTEAAGVTHEGQCRYPSRFLFEMDMPRHVEMLTTPGESLLREARAHIRAREAKLRGPQILYAPGVRVKHPVLGEGVILEVDHENQCCRVCFEEGGRERRIRFDGPLQRL